MIIIIVINNCQFVNMDSNIGQYDDPFVVSWVFSSVQFWRNTDFCAVAMLVDFPWAPTAWKESGI